MYGSLFRNHSTNIFGRSFSEQDKINVWCKAQIVPGYNAAVIRKDTCGAWIKFAEYGNTSSQYGWEIDHIYPAALGGSDLLSNLQPLQWKNNRHKSDSVGVSFCQISAAV